MRLNLIRYQVIIIFNTKDAFRMCVGSAQDQLHSKENSFLLHVDLHSMAFKIELFWFKKYFYCVIITFFNPYFTHKNRFYSSNMPINDIHWQYSVFWRKILWIRAMSAALYFFREMFLNFLLLFLNLLLLRIFE